MRETKERNYPQTSYAHKASNRDTEAEIFHTMHLKSPFGMKMSYGRLRLLRKEKKDESMRNLASVNIVYCGQI